MLSVNEQTRMTITAAFTDEAGVALTPAFLSYRLLDYDTGEEILPWVTVVPSAATYAMTIPAQYQTLLEADKEYELRRLVLVYKFGTGGAQRGTGEYIYKLVNLRGL